MTYENVKNTTFVLKDQNGNYVSSGSIYFYEETSRVVYSFSRFLTNGFFSHPTQKMAEVELAKLQAMENRFQLGKQFRIEEIDRYATLLEESKSEELRVGLSSIIHEYKPFNDGKRYVWVIRDSKGNFTHGKSIKKWDSKTWVYVSSETFSPESRAYTDLLQAERWLDALRYEAEKMRLNETFHLEYMDLKEAIKQHKGFDGDNIVIVEKKVS